MNASSKESIYEFDCLSLSRFAADIAAVMRIPHISDDYVDEDGELVRSTASASAAASDRSMRRTNSSGGYGSGSGGGTSQSNLLFTKPSTSIKAGAVVYDPYGRPFTTQAAASGWDSTNPQDKQLKE